MSSRKLSFGAYVLPDRGDRESAVRAAAAIREAGADFVVAATTGPERSRYTSTNQAIDLAAACATRTGLPATATVTTWSSSVVSLQAHLLGAHARGITRMVCGNGSAPEDAISSSRGRWAIDVTELIALMRGLNRGIDRFGRSLEEPTRFEVGVRIRAVPSLTVEDRTRILRKLDAGADFVVSSPIYHPDSLAPLLEIVEGRVPVYATVHPIQSAAEALLLRSELADGCVPKEVVTRLKDAGADASTEGASIAADSAATVADRVAGIIVSRCRPDVIELTRTRLAARDELPDES